MTDLADRLNAALDRAEQTARAAAAQFAGTSGLVWENRSGDSVGPADAVDNSTVAHGRWDYLGDEIADHIALNDPAHVLRTVAAHRNVALLHGGVHDCREFISGVYPDDWPADAPYGTAGERWSHVSTEHFDADEPCPTLRGIASIYLPDLDQGEPR